MNSNSKQCLGLCVMLVMGCGAPDEQRDGGVSGPQASPDAGPPVVDAGLPVTDAGLPVTDAGLAAPDAGPRRVGTVLLFQQRLVIPGLADPLWANGVTAAFAEQSGCTVSQAGPCQVTECSPGASQGVLRSAGTITFGGLVVDGGVHLSFANGYATQQLQGQVFTFGTPLTVSASGGDVPAFSASVMAPEGTLLTAPVCQSSNCGVAAKSRPLEVTWSAPTFGEAVVELVAGMSQLRCTVMASNRRVVLPADLLARLPTGQGLLTVGGAASATVAAGDWDLTFTARDTVFGLVELQP